MTRPDSRLDAEYDPAERHDLDRLENRDPCPPGAWPWTAVCACGTTCPTLGGARTRGEARAEHQEHHDYELGVRP